MYSISYIEPARKPEPAARTFWPAPARARIPPASTEPEPANFRPEPIPICYTSPCTKSGKFETHIYSLKKKIEY